MTTPTLKSALPAGAIVGQHVTSDFADYIAGRPATQRIVLSVVQVSAVHASTQEKGRSNKATYETVHAVEITDPHEADQLRHRLTQIRASRGLEVSQPALFAATEAEQVEQLQDLIKDWASAQDIPIAEIDARFVEYFGGSENASAETVQACRSALQLQEFAYEVGAIPEEQHAEPADPPFSDTDSGDELEDDEA